jgi:signal peptidase I
MCLGPREFGAAPSNPYRGWTTVSIAHTVRPLGAKSCRASASLLRRIAVGLFAGAVIAVLFSLFAPTIVGGPASYVVTDGISMLPKFHANGLVITRERSDYHVGEVVAYHNHQLGKVVMHRIVGRDGGRYVFKGDNNDFADQYHAKRSDLVGKEWVYWPGGGRYLNMLRNPFTFAVILGLVTLAAFWGPKHSRRRRRHHA